MPVYSCNKFEEYELLLIHDRFSKNETQNALNNLMNCQKSINMKSGQFTVIEMQDSRNF